MEKEIKDLAEECLNCINPTCIKGCPLKNNIPQFINYIKQNEEKKAWEELNKTTIYQSICGKICPHEKQCEGNCIKNKIGKPTKIGKIEEYLGNLAEKNKWYLEEENIEKIKENNKELINKKVAIIGSGPSGLTCSYWLAKNGIKVDIYEKDENPGGLLNHGIPDFRISKEKTNNIVERLKNLDVSVITNTEIEKDITIAELLEKYDSIFIGIGANSSKRMNIEGENQDNVFFANELLENENYPDFNDKIITVNGGGDVALDMVRVAIRKKPKKVNLLYRRSENEMPAQKQEIEQAKKEGVEFYYQTDLIKIENNKIECQKTKLIEDKNSTRKVPVNIENSNFKLETDYLIEAIGSKPNKQLIENFKKYIETTDKDYIKVNENYETSNPKIYAGGDIIGSNQTIATASRDGRKASKTIIEKLKSKD